MQMFSSAQSRDFLLSSAFSLKWFIHVYLLQGFFECYVPEICLQLRYAWTEILSLQSDVQYVTLPVTEIPKMFIHSCHFWLMAGGPSLSDFNYANHFWRPSYTNNYLSTLHCHMQWTCNCAIKWKWFRKTITADTFVFFYFFLSSFLPLDGFISSAVDVTTPGLLSCSGYFVYMHGVVCYM